ncbi:MAG: hypothetical protein HXX81_00180 [Campylobacterales bacterium]|nr:hypothetical protein [Campylobacterales bacterium]
MAGEVGSDFGVVFTNFKSYLVGIDENIKTITSNFELLSSLITLIDENQKEILTLI